MRAHDERHILRCQVLHAHRHSHRHAHQLTLSPITTPHAHLSTHHPDNTSPSTPPHSHLPIHTSHSHLPFAPPPHQGDGRGHPAAPAREEAVLHHARRILPQGAVEACVVRALCTARAQRPGAKASGHPHSALLSARAVLIGRGHRDFKRKSREHTKHEAKRS